MCLASRKINMNKAFVRQTVGGKQTADQVWPVSFMHYDSGFFDSETFRVVSTENPLAPDTELTMCPE